MHRLVPALVRQMGTAYPELSRAQALIGETLKLEETRFKQTLERGLRLLDDELAKLGEGQPLPGAAAFRLYDTFGFPLDLTQDALREKGRTVDIKGFDARDGRAEGQGARRLGRARARRRMPRSGSTSPKSTARPSSSATTPRPPRARSWRSSRTARRPDRRRPGRRSRSSSTRRRSTPRRAARSATPALIRTETGTATRDRHQEGGRRLHPFRRGERRPDRPRPAGEAGGQP